MELSGWGASIAWYEPSPAGIIGAESTGSPVLSMASTKYSRFGAVTAPRAENLADTSTGSVLAMMAVLLLVEAANSASTMGSGVPLAPFSRPGVAPSSTEADQLDTSSIGRSRLIRS